MLSHCPAAKLDPEGPRGAVLLNVKPSIGAGAPWELCAVQPHAGGDAGEWGGGVVGRGNLPMDHGGPWKGCPKAGLAASLVHVLLLGHGVTAPFPACDRPLCVRMMQDEGTWGREADGVCAHRNLSFNALTSLSWKTFQHLPLQEL